MVSEYTARTYTCRRCSVVWETHYSICPACNERGTVLPTGMKLELSTLRRSGLVVISGNVDKTSVKRIPTGIRNLDEIFGQDSETGLFGLPEGFVIQLVGSPGAGKSTLLTQLVGGLLVSDTLYITAEETAQRVTARAYRLNVPGKDRIPIAETTSLELTKQAIEETKARVVVVDSLQGLRKLEEDREELARNVEDDSEENEQKRQRKRPRPQKHVKHTQLVVRDIAMELIEVSRKGKHTMILVGHVNKEGDLAGMKEIEHMVDIVARFDQIGGQMSARRDLWFKKNREADTGVRAIFEMTKQGLIDRGVLRPGVASVAPASQPIVDPSSES